MNIKAVFFQGIDFVILYPIELMELQFNSTVSQNQTGELLDDFTRHLSLVFGCEVFLLLLLLFLLVHCCKYQKQHILIGVISLDKVRGHNFRGQESSFNKNKGHSHSSLVVTWGIVGSCKYLFYGAFFFIFMSLPTKEEVLCLDGQMFLYEGMPHSVVFSSSLPAAEICGYLFAPLEHRRRATLSTKTQPRRILGESKENSIGITFS